MSEYGLRISIIVPAYNNEATLGECIQACLSQSHPAEEIIVVDDGSTDGTTRIAQAHRVRYIRQENSGPAAARNRGAAVAKGSILAFTDADCVPASDWLERLGEGFGEGVSAVGGTYGIANPESRLARIIHEEIALRHSRFGNCVDFLGSFNVAYRKEAFEAAGGFDESFLSASAEDNDLAYRLAEGGGALRYRKEAVVGHYHPERYGPYLRSQMNHGFWRMKLYAKHLGRAPRGDQYAPWPNLVAPPLALAQVILLLALPVAISIDPAKGLLFSFLACVPILPWIALHLPMAGRMVKQSGNRECWAFLPLACARDCARAWGMVRGILRFFVFRSGRA